jgi:hypothetical protein
MSFAAVESIVQALLYEGYLLYPYRRSALKNRQRWLFGRLLPREFSAAQGEAEAWKSQTECLIVGTPRTVLDARVRFLQLTEGTDADANPSSRDTIERQFSATANLGHITGESRSTAFTFPPQLTGAVTLTAREVLPGRCNGPGSRSGPRSRTAFDAYIAARDGRELRLAPRPA